MNSKSSAAVSSHLSLVSTTAAKPTRTMNGKPLTEAQNRARDLRNAKLVEKRAAKKAMMAKLPEFGTIVPSDGAFVPEAAIEPIAVLGELVEETVIAEAAQEDPGLALDSLPVDQDTAEFRAFPEPTGFVPYVQTNGTVHLAGTVGVDETIFIPAPSKSKPAAARKTDRRWGIDEASKNANTMFRAFRKAGLVCGDSGTDPALAVAKAAAEGKLGAVTATTKRSEWTHEFHLAVTPHAADAVSKVLADLGREFNFDEATSTFNVTHR